MTKSAAAQTPSGRRKRAFVGGQIAGRRQVQRLTQEELAQKLGISRVQVANYENGYQIPSIDTLYKIAKVFECEVADLIPTRSEAR